MNQQLILHPVIVMFILTGAVWLFMYIRRLVYILGNKIDPQSVATPELLNSRIPADINSPSNNLKNLFELPVLFYALCLVLVLTQRVDEAYLYAAWTYVGLRILHSAVHCTVNIVMWRFIVYASSSLVLWLMVIRLALQMR
jgi:hypothetical protein